MSGALIRLVLIVIAAITAVSGAAQLLAPAAVLRVIATSEEPFAAQLFATVGMFMFITGSMFLQSLWTNSQERAIPLWIGVQKLAAAGLVYLGWSSGFFVTISLGIVGFDAATGVLCFMFWRRLKE